MNSFSNGDILGGLKAAGTTYNTFKNTNLSKIATAEITNAAINYVNQTPNRQLPFAIPAYGTTGGSRYSVNGSVVPNAGQPSPEQVGVNSYPGQQLPNGTTGPRGR
jgi:hypothetical protein